ncbi:MAG: hypothetical protein ABI700_08865 [Chloroflexota bacterium]
MTSKQVLGGLVLVLCFITCTGCTFLGMPSVAQTPTPRSSTLFTYPACISGCWNNLRPGYSTVADLTALGFAKHSTDNQSSLYGTPDAAAEVDSTGTLVMLELFGPMDLSLDHVVEVLGEPEYAAISAGSSGEVFYLSGRLEMYYPAAGLYFDSDVRGGITANSDSKGNVTVCIDQNNLVVRGRIVKPGALADMADELNFPESRTGSSILLSRLKPWQGFGCHIVP